MKTCTIWTFLLALTLASAALTGCGGKTEPSPSAQTDATNAADAETTYASIHEACAALGEDGDIVQTFSLDNGTYAAIFNPADTSLQLAHIDNSDGKYSITESSVRFTFTSYKGEAAPFVSSFVGDGTQPQFNFIWAPAEVTQDDLAGYDRTLDDYQMFELGSSYFYYAPV